MSCNSPEQFIGIGIDSPGSGYVTAEECDVWCLPCNDGRGAGCEGGGGREGGGESEGEGEGEGPRAVLCDTYNVIKAVTPTSFLVYVRDI
jgi:hypothetical protein